MTEFAQRLLAWYAQYGRKDLPWQQTRDPYAIWISEIMLQQTQVAAVIPYYTRFLARFPDIAQLAAAPLDSVLQHWTGLGYYARARNLHRAAQTIMTQHDGTFPRDFEAVCALPGIGASTAGAVLAFAFEQQYAILDGNVKRVLARYHRVEGWPGQPAVTAQLWAHARAHTPATALRAYTQAIMDFGATLCKRTPLCAQCPVQDTCLAYAHNETRVLPQPKPRKPLPLRQTVMLLIRNASGELLMEQRPPQGLWGGLWGFPECADSIQAATYVANRWGWDAAAQTPWPQLHHSFTHFHLAITPLPMQLSHDGLGIMDANIRWHAPHTTLHGGVSAPVKQLLDRLRNTPWPAPSTASN